MIKKTNILVVVVLMLGVCDVEAVLVWESGHHVFSEGTETFVSMYNDASAEISGGWISEFGMYDDTTADVTGGEIQMLLGQNDSSVTVYDDSVIGLLRPNDFSMASVYGGDINVVFALGTSNTNIYDGLINEIDAKDFSTVSLYVESYELDPTGGTFQDGLLTGIWLNTENSFHINLRTENTINHIEFIPEPGSISLLLAGAVMLLSKSSKRTKGKR